VVSAPPKSNVNLDFSSFQEFDGVKGLLRQISYKYGFSRAYLQVRHKILNMLDLQVAVIVTSFGKHLTVGRAFVLAHKAELEALCPGCSVYLDSNLSLGGQTHALSQEVADLLERYSSNQISAGSPASVSALMRSPAAVAPYPKGPMQFMDA